mmetsp:Transcript_21693/g.51301  ORF Transcript_21693/g.51301 Transcript_21693/m.51301 type:complete len:351 (-) Transcript_21693:142-1194(-)
MQIFVKGPNQTKVFEMEGMENGKHLQGKVEERFGIAADFQSLSYAGKQVTEESKLSDILTDGCTVHLALPMFGGFSGGAPDIADGLLDLYSFDGMDGYAPERPGGLPERTRVLERVPDDMFVDVPSLPDDDLAAFDMDADSMDFLKSTVQACDVSAPTQPIFDMEYNTDSSASTPNNEERQDSPREDVANPNDIENQRATEHADPEWHSQSATEGGGGFTFPADTITPYDAPYDTPYDTPRDTPNDGSLPMQKAKRTKGVAFDLDSVDDKMRRRLIKNRQSAERSRQKKNALMKELEDELHKTRMENVALKRECQSVKSSHVSLMDENESLRALLQAHGLSLDAAPAHTA